MQTINHGKIALYLAVVNFLGTPDHKGQVESIVELLYARPWNTTCISVLLDGKNSFICTHATPLSYKNDSCVPRS